MTASLLPSLRVSDSTLQRQGTVIDPSDPARGVGLCAPFAAPLVNPARRPDAPARAVYAGVSGVEAQSGLNASVSIRIVWLRPFAFRTDRHNNPTAMTTDVAAQAGLIMGKDYLKGDRFTGADGRTYYTAKLLGDPIETTIRALDQGGLYTSSGRARWTYLHRIPIAARWFRLTRAQKAAIVMRMYHMEGGSGALASRPAAADYLNPSTP